VAETVRNLTIGVIGVGMVGEPIRWWFEEKRGLKRNLELFCYDTDPARGYFDDYNLADVVFISVPTPPNPDGSCNTSIVESVVAGVKGEKIIVIKSTVPPGTTEADSIFVATSHTVILPPRAPTATSLRPSSVNASAATPPSSAAMRFSKTSLVGFMSRV